MRYHPGMILYANEAQRLPRTTVHCTRSKRSMVSIIHVILGMLTIRPNQDSSRSIKSPSNSPKTPHPRRSDRSDT